MCEIKPKRNILLQGYAVDGKKISPLNITLSDTFDMFDLIKQHNEAGRSVLISRINYVKG